MKVFYHQTLTVVLCGRLTDGFTSLTNNELPHRKHKLRTALNAAPEGMKWFVKTETFAKPYPEVKQYLEEHREWLERRRNVPRTRSVWTEHPLPCFPCSHRTPAFYQFYAYCGSQFLRLFFKLSPFRLGATVFYSRPSLRCRIIVVIVV